MRISMKHKYGVSGVGLEHLFSVSKAVTIAIWLQRISYMKRYKTFLSLRLLKIHAAGESIAL